jgi:hypothetical protein
VTGAVTRPRRTAAAPGTASEADGYLRHADAEGMTLLDVEMFCAALREAGAEGDCPVYSAESAARLTALTAWPARHVPGTTPPLSALPFGGVTPAGSAGFPGTGSGRPAAPGVAWG